MLFYRYVNVWPLLLFMFIATLTLFCMSFMVINWMRVLNWVISTAALGSFDSWLMLFSYVPWVPITIAWSIFMLHFFTNSEMIESLMSTMMLSIIYSGTLVNMEIFLKLDVWPRGHNAHWDKWWCVTSVLLQLRLFVNFLMRFLVSA